MHHSGENLNSKSIDFHLQLLLLGDEIVENLEYITDYKAP